MIATMLLDAWVEHGGPPTLLESLGVADPDELARAVAPRELRWLLGAPEPVADGAWIDPAALGAVRPFRERRALRQRVGREVAPDELPGMIAAYEARAETRDLARLRARWPVGGGGQGPQDAAAGDARRAEEERQRLRRQLAEIDAARAAHPGGLDVLTRASRYLAAIEGGPGGAWKGALALVRGWALPEGVVLRMLESEYAPRYHRAIGRAELAGMVRRAARATNTGYGWLVRGER